MFYTTAVVFQVQSPFRLLNCLIDRQPVRFDAVHLTAAWFQQVASLPPARTGQERRA